MPRPSSYGLIPSEELPLDDDLAGDDVRARSCIFHGLIVLSERYCNVSQLPLQPLEIVDETGRSASLQAGRGLTRLARSAQSHAPTRFWPNAVWRGYGRRKKIQAAVFAGTVLLMFLALYALYQADFMRDDEEGAGPRSTIGDTWENTMHVYVGSDQVGVQIAVRRLTPRSSLKVGLNVGCCRLLVVHTVSISSQSGPDILLVPSGGRGDSDFKQQLQLYLKDAKLVWYWLAGFCVQVP